MGDKVYIKPGIKNNEMIQISPRVMLIIEHELSDECISFENNNIHLNVELTINDILCGFVKEIHYGNESVVLASEHIFNFQEEFVIHGKGVVNKGDLIVHFKANLHDINTKLYKRIGKVIRNVLKLSFDFSNYTSSDIIHIN